MKYFRTNPLGSGFGNFFGPRKRIARKTVAIAQPEILEKRVFAGNIAQITGLKLIEELSDPGAERLKQSLQRSNTNDDLEIICETFNLNDSSELVKDSIDLSLAVAELLKQEFSAEKFIENFQVSGFSPEAFLRSLVEYAFAHKPNTEDGLNNFSTNFISLYKHIVKDSPV